jgi:hypothetical protein
MLLARTSLVAPQHDRANSDKKQLLTTQIHSEDIKSPNNSLVLPELRKTFFADQDF